MKTVKQLLRQPFKTAAGIIIVALAFAILVTCVGQYTATELTRTNLDDRYDTIGLLSDAYLRRRNENGGVTYLSRLPEETQEWIDETIQARTDLVKTVSSTGLVSAYIPELSVDNFSKYENGYNMSMYNQGYPYRCAMLAVTLTKIGTVGIEDFRRVGVELGWQDLLIGTTFLCVGTVDDVIGLEEGFESPVGKKIVLHINVFDQEDFDALDLKVGQTYLVYGEDYASEDEFTLHTQIANHKTAYEELFGKLHYTLGGTLDYGPMLAQYYCVLTLRDPCSLPTYTPTFDEEGNISTFTILVNQREVYNRNGRDFKISRIPTDEFNADYQLPTITPLNGSAEEFIASEEGALWQEALNKMEINNHGFPVLCVDKLGYQAVFSREQARIVDGRDFSEGELTSGEKVCIIAQSLAAQNGLQVGDTIELRTYAYDPTFELQLREMMSGASFPNAALYSKARGFTSEMERYTIVGLYRQEDAWQNRDDAYGFTPNTIFVPKASVTAEMETREKGIYSTLVIETGKKGEFQALMEEAGYPGLFACYDQGYSEIMAALDSYQGISGKALYIGIAAFAAVMLLFLLLFPVQQKRPLALMGTLGASGTARFRHTAVSTLCILIPGAVLGGFAGSKLWTRIASALMEWINVQITLESDMAAVAPVLTAVSLAAAAIAALAVSAALCRDKGLMKRK